MPDLYRLPVKEWKPKEQLFATLLWCAPCQEVQPHSWGWLESAHWFQHCHLRELPRQVVVSDLM